MMLTNIPPYIGGAKTLYIARLDTGCTTVVRNGKEIIIEFISVCQYDPKDGFYLFGCDKEFNTHTDYFYDELEEALDDAKRLYQTNDIIWVQV
jgi:hypothetical protein